MLYCHPLKNITSKDRKVFIDYRKAKTYIKGKHILNGALKEIETTHELQNYDIDECCLISVKLCLCKDFIGGVKIKEFVLKNDEPFSLTNLYYNIVDSVAVKAFSIDDLKNIVDCLIYNSVCYINTTPINAELVNERTRLNKIGDV